MRDKLAQFGVEDPNPDTNVLPEMIGVFTGETYGAYFTEKFTYLTDRGALSELDALYVGAFIEELDMHDIIDAVIGKGNYEAQYLSQEEVDAILGR